MTQLQPMRLIPAAMSFHNWCCHGSPDTSLTPVTAQGPSATLPCQVPISCHGNHQFESLATPLLRYHKVLL